MKKYLLFAILLLASSSLRALAAVDFYPLDQLRVGQKGVGYTVIRGTKIESFNAEIIDVLPTGGFDGGPLILARFSGDVIEQSGGIAAGYSGSPVYIEGKLLGAISSAVPFSDQHVGGITPIQSMLSALPRRKELDYSNNTVVPEPYVGKRSFKYSASPSQAEGTEGRTGPVNKSSIGAKPLAAPLLVRGASPKSMHLLREALKDNPYLQVVAGGAGYGPAPRGLLSSPSSSLPLSAGDAIAVSLIQGDIELAAIGTLTYVDEAGQVLAFGHPFFLSGEASYPLGKAYIAYTHKSIALPFKDGFRLNSVGAITSDRMSAVGGLLGKNADLLPLNVVVNDIDLRREREFKAEVIKQPELFDVLVAFVVGEAFVRVTDMQKGGTLRVEFFINGVGLKEPIKRTNYFYNEFEPISVLWEEALPLASLLINNIYRKVDITELKVKIDFTRNRVNASIDDAKIITEEERKKREEKKAEEKKETEISLPEASSGEESPESSKENEDANGEEVEEEGGIGVPLQAPGQMVSDVEGLPGQEEYLYPEPPKTVHPGDTLQIEVRLQPFRQDPVFKTIYLTIPEDFPTGMTNITVRGGGTLVSLFNEFGGRGKMLFGTGMFMNVDADIHDLDKIIEKALSTPLNNELVVSILKPIQTPPPPGSSEEEDNNEEKKKEREFKITLPTQWVIYNQRIIPINIQPKGAEKQSQQLSEKSKEKEKEE